MPEHRTSFDVLTSDGCRLAGEVRGPPGLTPLILAHPIGFDRRFWNDVAALLATSFRLILPDARGHGASARGPGETRIERLADDVLEILDTLGIERAAVAGCSMGSATAMRLGAAEPGRIEWLILANAPARIPLPREQFDAVIAQARGRAYESLAQGMIARWIAPQTAQDRPEWVAARLAEMVETDADGFADAYAALRDSDRNADLAQIEQPTLVVAGELDSFSPDQARSMASLLTNGRAVSVPDAAHLVPLEQPVAFANLLSSFAKELEKTRLISRVR